MKKWLKKLEDIMAAVAFAEAGEFETAKETLKEQRKILLALSGTTSDTNAFRYALNTCKRIGAELEIIYDSNQAKGSLKQLQPELKKRGIAYSSIRRNGCLEEEIQNYTSINQNILFVVVEVPSEVSINSKKANKNFEESWKNLKCPLVTVSKPSAA